VIAGRGEEHLRLVLQAPECLAVDDTVAIALERGTDVVFRLRAEAPARLGAPGRLRRQVFALTLFEIVSDAHR
jgi:hypothetical protein